MARPSTYIDESLLVDDSYYVAGQQVAPGTYVDLETRREIHMESEDCLPATCDGRVATYVQRPLNWARVSGSAN